MTRLTLSDACLMEASGELGAKAHEKLQSHIEKFPAALLEFEIARGNLELLRTLPKVELSKDERRQISSNIKVGIQQKLWREKHAQMVAHRWKLAYRVLAGVSGVAACLVIGAGVMWVQEQNELRAVRTAEQLVNGYLAAGQTNVTDRQFGAVSQDIDDLLNGMAASLSASRPPELSAFMNDDELAPSGRTKLSPSDL